MKSAEQQHRETSAKATADDPADEYVCLERWVQATIGLAEATIKTFVVLLCFPQRSAHYANATSARPLTFLMISLITSGLMIEAVLLYHGRKLDENLFSLFAQAVSSWGMRELFLMTIPPLFVVWVIAFLAARLIRVKAGPTKDSRLLMHGLCHSVGTQLLIIATAATLLIAIKASNPESTDDHRWTKDIIVAPLLIAIGLAGFLQFERLLAKCGGAAWLKHSLMRVPYAAVVSLLCITGVIRVAAETFDFNNARKLGQRLSLEEWSGKARILADVLDSHVIAEPLHLGWTVGMKVDLKIALTNVTDLPHAVARPTRLRVIRDGSPQFIEVLDQSTAAGDQPGWVLQPGETRIVSWTLKVPPEMLANQVTVATFACVEIDLQRWHREIERPTGEPSDCYVSLDCHAWLQPAAPRAASTVSGRTAISTR